MLLSMCIAAAGVALPSRHARLQRARAGHDHTMTVSLSKEEAAEEAYWRRWFWEQAEQAIDEQFSSASKRELKRVREYIKANSEDEPKKRFAGLLPKKLCKNPHYEVIGGFFPGLTVTPFHECSGPPWDTLAGAYPAIKAELDALIARDKEFVDVGKPLGWCSVPIHCTSQAQDRP